METVKIEFLMIRNFKRVHLAEVELSPNGLNIIGGANAQGKSTFLDAVKFLLGGKKYAPSQPHNLKAEGATAVVRCQLSNGIHVERSGKSSTLKVVVDEKKGNQATLKEFLNEFALDVSKFVNATDKEKCAMLIEHLGIGDKLEHLDKKIDNLFGERTVVGREADSKKKLADSIQTYEKAPEERIDVSKLLTKERELSAENREHESRVQKMDNIREEAVKRKERVAELKKEIEAHEAKLKDLKTDFLDLQSKTQDFTPHDLSTIEEQMKNAESLNLMFESNAKAKAAKQEAEETQKRHQRLTDEIEEARAQRVKLIEEIKMPLPGLTISEGELLYKGQKWDCMSGSERLKVATAISRAFKPECGFVLVDELEQLDWKTIQEFDAWAKDEGIQILGAMVCDEDKAGENVIIIEDGRVKGAEA